MKCPEYKLCADYRNERIRCCFFYGSCKTRKDIETARIHLKAEHLSRLVGQSKSLDAFDNVEVWRNE